MSGTNPETSPFSAELAKGRVALVTGGGSGIGFEIARQVRDTVGISLPSVHSSSRSQLGLHGAKVMVFGRRENFLREAVDVLTRAGCEAGMRRANMRLSSASC